MRYLILLIILIVFFGCQSDKGTNTFNSVNPVKRIESFNDSVFMFFVSDIIQNGSNIYISDFKSNQLLQLDTNLQLKRLVKKIGKGPGDFNGIIQMTTSNSNLYALDDGNRRINIYNKDLKYEHQIDISPHAPILSVFAANNENIFISPLRYNKFPIVRINIQNGSTLNFGEIISNDLFDPEISNPRHLILTNNKIIAISVVYPIIETYTLNGKLLSKNNFDSLETFVQYFKQLKKDISNNKQLNNRTVDLFKDVYYNNGYILLLKWEIIKNKFQRFCRDVIVLKEEKNGFSYFKTIRLKPEYKNYNYSAFCIWKNKLIAFETNKGELHEFIVNISEEY